MKQIKTDPSFNILAIVAVGWLIVILAMFFGGHGIFGDYLVGSVLIFTTIFLVLAAEAHKKYQTILDDYATLNATKSEFTSVISHQLRTPIAAARWSLELVLDGTYGRINNPKIKQALISVYRNMNSLNEGMDNLVTVTEIEDHIVYNKPIKFELDSEIKWLIKEFTPEANLKKVKFALTAERGSTSVLADKHKIYYVLHALFSNAVEYSNPGKIINIVLERQGDFVCMRIGNQGLRLEPGAAELIFDKYYRSEAAKQIKPNGLGLSLFIAKVFAEANSGKLYVSQNSAKQTEFTLKIPAAEN